MTYQPNMGYQQQSPHGFPPSGGDTSQVPPPAGAHWPAMPPPAPPKRRRPAALIAIMLAILVVAGGALTIVLTSGESTSWLAGAPGSSHAAAPTAGSDASETSSAAPSSSRPLPPPIPTGRPYDNDDPQIGDCVDLARRSTGIIIYQANCDDPAATLILETILPENEKCSGKGFFGLKTFTRKVMCFTHNFTTGECVDMQIPRRVACDDSTAGRSIAKVVEVRLGQQDGADCTNPRLIYQVGKGDERGVACMIADTKQNSSTQPSR